MAVPGTARGPASFLWPSRCLDEWRRLFLLRRLFHLSELGVRLRYQQNQDELHVRSYCNPRRGIPKSRPVAERWFSQLPPNPEANCPEAADSRPPDIPPALNVRFQVAGDGAARGAGLGLGPGKASPIVGRGWMAKRIVRRDPGKTVAVSVSVAQSACTARVRCGELSGQIVTRSSVSVTSMSAAAWKSSCNNVRPSSSLRA